jgi:hypothetical protein
MSAFDAGSAMAPVRFRSPAQFYPLVGFALLVTAFGLIGSLQDLSSVGETGATLEAAFALLCGVGLVTLAFRGALLASKTGITIRNPLGRTRHIPWTEITEFKIGRYKLLGAVCLVELRDGSTAHAWAIQIPHASRNPAASREAKMTEELNRLLAADQKPAF